MRDLDVAFNYLIIEDEGSKYTNDPKDSGGPTKWGVTIATYRQFFPDVVVTPKDIEHMTAATAKQIYDALYWTPLHCEKIVDLGIKTAIFDCGVLYGVHEIALLTQKALAMHGVTLKSDGILGDKTVGLLNEFLGGEKSARTALMRSIRGLLLEHIDGVIAKHPHDERYRHGWTLRADRLLQLLDDDYLNKYKEELFS